MLKKITYILLYFLQNEEHALGKSTIENLRCPINHGKKTNTQRCTNLGDLPGARQK
jgi:hypothetical protein